MAARQRKQTAALPLATATLVARQALGVAAQGPLGPAQAAESAFNFRSSPMLDRQQAGLAVAVTLLAAPEAVGPFWPHQAAGPQAWLTRAAAAEVVIQAAVLSLAALAVPAS
jgi:hypothetical protein